MRFMQLWRQKFICKANGVRALKTSTAGCWRMVVIVMIVGDDPRENAGSLHVHVHGSRQTLLPGLEGGLEQERSFARKQRSGRDNRSAENMSQAPLTTADEAMGPGKCAKNHLQRGTTSWRWGSHDDTLRHTLDLVLLGEERGVELAPSARIALHHVQVLWKEKTGNPRRSQRPTK